MAGWMFGGLETAGFRACLLVGKEEGALGRFSRQFVLIDFALIDFTRSEHESSRCHEVDPGKRGQLR
jgi:hypothetical protein